MDLFLYLSFDIEDFLSQYGVSIKRGRTEEEYFASTSDEEKEKEDDDGYQPAPGSPGPDTAQEEEDDPLDAYMKELETEAATKVW